MASDSVVIVMDDDDEDDDEDDVVNESLSLEVNRPLFAFFFLFFFFLLDLDLDLMRAGGLDGLAWSSTLARLVL